MSKRFKAIKEHFESAAKHFDREFFKVAPHYHEGIEALVLALPFKDNSKIKVIDLGCGTGNITLAVKKRYPRARVACLDMARNMIEMARVKLKAYRDIEYWLGDIRKYDYRALKPDAVVSSLVLHHLEKRQKKEFYRKIYAALSRGGAFYTADFVLPTSPYLQKMGMEQWKKFMLRSLPPKRVERVLKMHKNEDKPAELTFELELLRAAGFRHVDVIWKNYNFAVYGGVK